VQTNKSLYELAEAVLQDAGLASDKYIIDTALQNITIKTQSSTGVTVATSKVVTVIYTGSDFIKISEV
jgi:hypothetical protein